MLYRESVISLPHEHLRIVGLKSLLGLGSQRHLAHYNVALLLRGNFICVFVAIIAKDLVVHLWTEKRLCPLAVVQELELACFLLAGWLFRLASWEVLSPVPAPVSRQ